MRRTRFFPALAVLILSACNQQIIDSPAVKGEGEVVFSLSADEKVEIVGVKSGTQENLPDLGDFWIELVNSENVKFRREKYADVEGKTIGMNAGEFTFMAKHGDSLGVGFDKPFYMAKQNFTVEPQKLARVEAVARLANVKVAVNYGEQIRLDYTGFYTVVKHVVHKRTSLKFIADETRAGYIPGGQLTVTVYAMVDGELKCFTLKDDNGETVYIDATPNDFITFSVNTGVNYGGLVIDMKIDNETEPVEKQFMVPADAASNIKPAITLSSFDEDGIYYVTEGREDAADDVSFTYKSYAGVAECQLATDCDFLEAKGVPSVIDFAALNSTELTALEDIGFFWAEYGGIGVIDFAGFIPALAKASVYNGPETVAGTFTLTVKDTEGQTVSSTVKIMVRPDVTAVISLDDYNVWATKVVNPIVTLSKGTPTQAKVQSSADGQSWSDFMDVLSSPFAMGTITGLTPSTTYYLRVIYDGKYPVSDVLSLTTEDALQLGNAGFESWTTQKHGYAEDGLVTDESATRDWYRPWGADDEKWWDVNSKKTMPTLSSQQYPNYKVVPTVSYSEGNNSSYSAQLVSTYVCNMASDVNDGNSFWGNLGGGITGEGVVYYKAAGEIFLGKAASDGSYAMEGHEFASRPSSLTFDYKYSSYNSETFQVRMYVKDASGNVIASKETTASGSSSWATMTLDFNYSNTMKKAASIAIYFRSSSCADNDISYRRTDVTIAGTTQKSYIGSILTIDNLKLNY